MGRGLLIHEGVPWGWKRWRRTACSALVCVPFSSSHFGPAESPRKCYSFDSSLTFREAAAGVWAGPGPVVLSMVVGVLGVPAVSWVLPMSLDLW